MKISKIILLLFLTISTLPISGFAGNSEKKTAKYPQYEGEITIPDLKADVVIYRDVRGMPHIYADNEQDLYFAVGFVMAQERLWQMDLIRRTGAGRLSEIFGKSFVRTDLFFRNLNITAKSLEVLKGEDQDILNLSPVFYGGHKLFYYSSMQKAAAGVPYIEIFSGPVETGRCSEYNRIDGLGIGRAKF